MLSRYCLPNIENRSEIPNQWESRFEKLMQNFSIIDLQEIGQDLIEAKHLFIYCIISCLVLLLLYAVVIYSMTMSFVWMTIVTTGLGIVGLSYLLMKYNDKEYKLSGASIYFAEFQKEDPNWTAIAL